MTKKELAQALRWTLFADRDTIDEAYGYALDIMGENKVVNQTALHVLMNTIANEIEKLED